MIDSSPKGNVRNGHATAKGQRPAGWAAGCRHLERLAPNWFPGSNNSTIGQKHARTGLLVLELSSTQSPGTLETWRVPLRDSAGKILF